MILPKYLKLEAQQDGDKQSEEVSMFIDGEIVTDEFYDSDTSAASFRDALNSLGDVKNINLHINSPGGSVFEGIAIYNMLKQNKAKINVYVDGLAASIASVIAMSGDTVYMPANAMMMIHNPWTIAMGNADELRKQADDLDQITKSSVVTYLNKAGDKLNEDTLKELMDNETWLTAQEALDYGLTDEVMEPNKAVASINREFAQRYHHVPKQLTEQSDKSSVNEAKKSVFEHAMANAEATGIALNKLKEELSYESVRYED